MLIKKALWVAPAAALVLVAAYAGIGFLALPAIVKSQAVQIAGDKLQRQLSIEQVEFNPFTLALTVRGLKLMEPKGDAVFVSFDTLALDLAGESLWRLAPVVQQLRLEQPYVHLVRTGANRYSIDDILAMLAAQPPSPEPARYSLNNLQLEGGRVTFEDRPANATHSVTDLKLGLPFISAMPADVQVYVEPLLSAKVNGAPLLVKGKARPFAEPKDVVVELNLDDVDLPRYLDYLPSKPSFKLSGTRLSAKLTASFRQPKEQGAALVLGGEASVKSLALAQADGKPVLKLAALDAKLGRLDVFAGRYEIERLSLDGLDAEVSRDRKGRLNIEQLMAAERPAAVAAKPASPSRAATPAQPSAAAGAAPAGAPQVTLKELDVRNASLRYVEDGLRANVEKFGFALRNVAADTGKKTLSVGEVASSTASILLRQGKRGAPVTVAAPAVKAVASADAPYVVSVGRVAIEDWSVRLEDSSHAEPSNLTFAPLSLALQDVSTAPAARSKLDLKATVNKSGQLAVNGTLGLAPFSTELALDLKNIDMLPLQPYATDYVNLRLTQAAISTSGKLQLATGSDGALAGGFKGDASVNNLSTVDKASSNDFLRWKALSFGGMDVRLQPFSMKVEQVALADFFARVIIDPSGRINVQDIKRSQANEDRSLTEAGARASAKPVKAAPPVQSAGAAAAAAEPLPPISIGKLTLSGGRVRFTDNFIRPNYTANLKELGGTVAGLSSDPGSNASVALHGEVNSAPLSIAGRINPLKRDLFLDLKAGVRDMELASLSAYSDKYVGYGIEKGKLSFEAAYLLENRQLKAENRLILNQLTFGDESTNPEATKLPVRLAVALLSDRNGVIDINVPVDGSLDDPQFSIGGIVLKIIGNALAKTVTAPFALLGSLFGGGEELSVLEFDAGYAVVSPTAASKLQSLAKALTERPGLKLDITGRVDPATDTEALKRVSVERKLKAMKARGEKVPGDAEKQLLATTVIGNDELLALAGRRAQAAKEWLASAGQVPAERLFIVNARDESPSAVSRVDFVLH